MRSLKFNFLVVTTLFLLISAQVVELLSGRVVGVTDGDTIKVLTADSTLLKIRLDGIDCPEKSQAFGTKAKQFASDLVFGRNVKVEKTGIDKYGRTLGYVIVSDSINLNKELLKAGLAWHYKKYNNNPELAQLEEEARRQKKGLWVDSLPIAPWDFRHGTGNAISSTNGNSTSSNQSTIENNSSIKVEGNVLICNSASSYAYHKYKCSGLSRCKSEIKEISQDQATTQGRTQCKVCKW